MLLLGGILLAVFVVPWPWGIATVLGGGLLDIGESLALLRWSKRRRSPVGAEALVGQIGIVATPTQVRVAGELWAFRADEQIDEGDSVRVEAVDGLALVVTRLPRAPR
jgi:membrane protein implicated in regulation of membrane protease activity